MVPGPLGQATGGYRYMARLAAGLAPIQVHELAGRFPLVDDAACAAATAAARGWRAGACVLIDGLALPAFAGLLDGRCWRLVAVVHHPLWLETGLAPADRAALAAIERALLAAADAVIATSSETVRDLAALGVAPGRVTVAQPGTDRPPPVRHRGRRLLTVATLVPRKGHLTVLAALQRLGPGWQLELVGSDRRDPRHAARVRTAIRLRGLARRVRVRGEVPDAALARAWRRAGLFVLPSAHEGYGMAVAEALAHGLPVVASQAGALSGVVPPRAGRLVPPGDARALAHAIRAVARGRARFGCGARAAAARLPGWDRTVAAVRWITEG